MVPRDLARPAALYLAMLALVGCDRDAAPRGAGATGTTAGATAGATGPSMSPAPGRSARPLPPHAVTPTLARLAIAATIPNGWDMAQTPDEADAGAAVFLPGDDSGEKGVSFLDVAPDVRLPASMEQAVSEAKGRQECEGDSGCSVLGSEAAPGGYLVTLRTPKTVFVMSWRKIAPGRVLQCRFELSQIVAATLHGGTWLDDPDAVARARREGEDLCRSAGPQS